MSVLSSFEVRAYAAPVLVVAVPAIAAIELLVVVLGGPWQWWQGLPAAVGVLGCLAAGHVGHGPGKRAEPGLWRRWGGAPSTAALRWSQAPNLLLHSELHATVAAAIGPRLHLPTREEERADPVAADDHYVVATARLIALTNSAQEFPQLKAHLEVYCYRRTLYGLRSAGLTIAYLTAVAAAACAAIDITSQASLKQTVATVGVALLAVGWAIALHRSGHRFVHTAARRYAHELFKAAYTLPRVAAANPPTSPRLAP